MPSIRRRRFLASLLTVPVGFSTVSNSFADEGDLRRTPTQDDSDLSAGCVVAWEGRNCYDGSVDFWTMRASNIDSTTFSSCVQRVVLWDDVFSLRTVRRRMDEISAAIPMHFGFDCRLAPSGFALHLDGLNTIDQTVARIFEATVNDPKRARTALIDLDSCGVTVLAWPKIISRLRGRYDIIIGVAHVTHVCTNPDKLRPIGSAGSFIYESTFSNMQKCDLSIVYSDIILSENSERNLEERDCSLSDLISSLTFWLRNERFGRRLSKRNLGERGFPRMFGISGLTTRITDEGHFNEVSAHRKVIATLFGSLSEEETVLMLDAGDECETIGTISLWPMATKWN
jgi:hypothetical protein